MTIKRFSLSIYKEQPVAIESDNGKYVAYTDYQLLLYKSNALALQLEVARDAYNDLVNINMLELQVERKKSFGEKLGDLLS